MSSTPLSVTYPGGCYLGFNAAIDRKSAEQLVFLVGDAVKNEFKSVNLCLSSVGGILDHAYYAFSMIEALDTEVVTWNTGNIQSAANLLFLCGDKRYATKGSTFFFHQTSYDPPPQRITEPWLAERLKAARYDDTRGAEIIAGKTGKPVGEVRSWQNTELVVTAPEAIANGLAHEVRELRIPANALFLQVQI